MPHRVLVVDDEESVRAVIRDFLRSKGYVVGTAGDGVAAIEAAEEGHPHLVVIDFLLPKKNGFAVAEAIRASEHGANTPLVMMSGVFKNPKTAVEAREKYQVLEFIGKPIDLDHLGHLIDDALSLIPEDDEAPDFGDSVEDTAQGMDGAVASATLSDSGVLAPRGLGRRPFPKMPEEGQIDQLPVALLVSICRYDRMTGMLDLTDQGTHRRVYVMGGQPVFMQSNADGENVGALLLRRGRITEPDFERCMEYMKGQKRTLQQALLDLRLATEHELATAYKLLAGQLLPMAVGMAQGHFRWRDTDAFVGRVPEGQFDAAKVLFDGIKRYVHPPQIMRFFQGREDIPLSRTPEFDDLLPIFRRAFSANNVTSLINDSATYRDITDARSEDLGAVVPQLFALVTSGMCMMPSVAGDDFLDGLGSDAASSIGGPDDFALNFSDDPAPRSSSGRFGSAVATTEAPGTPEDRAARARVQEAYDDYMSRNFFEIFDLPLANEVDEARLRSSYFDLAKRFHEDAFVGLDLGLSKRKLDELFARVKEAYDTLVKAEERKNYMIFLERERKGLPTDVQKIFRAEQVFDEGLLMLKRRDNSGASKKIEEAIQLNPGEAIFWAYKGWVTYLVDKNAVEAAINHLMRAIDTQENLPIAYQFLGQITAASERMKEAKKWFKRCLEWDPNNIEAARALRMIHSREEKDQQNQGKSGIGGVLDRLRKKN